jgi:hypothetical protein
MATKADDLGDLFASTIDIVPIVLVCYLCQFLISDEQGESSHDHLLCHVGACSRIGDLVSLLAIMICVCTVRVLPFLRYQCQTCTREGRPCPTTHLLQRSANTGVEYMRRIRGLHQFYETLTLVCDTNEVDGAGQRGQPSSAEEWTMAAVSTGGCAVPGSKDRLMAMLCAGESGSSSDLSTVSQAGPTKQTSIPSKPGHSLTTF